MEYSYEMTQEIAKQVLRLKLATQREVDATNTGVWNHTLELLADDYSDTRVIQAYTQAKESYYLANNMRLPNSKEPIREYYFAMLPEEDVGDDAMFYVVHQTYFDIEGYVDDRHIEESLLTNLDDPEDFQDKFAEACESMFESLHLDRIDTFNHLSSLPNFTHNPNILDG